jgi:hypothetical protein
MGSILGCRNGEETFENPLVGNPRANRDLDQAINMAQGTFRLSNLLNLRFSCHKLPNMDYFSKTDAFLVLYQQINNSWSELGRTEIVENQLDPIFVTMVPVRYYFEQVQSMILVAYDADDFSKKNLNLSDQSYIGETKFEMHSLVSSRDKMIETEFHEPHSEKLRGGVTIEFEEIQSESNSVLELELTT